MLADLPAQFIHSGPGSSWPRTPRTRVLLQPEMERRPIRVILQLGRSLAMRKPRKNSTPVEKVAILRRHLIDRVPVSDLCDEHQLSPTLFYLWQKQFFENGPSAFERKNAAP